MTYRFGYENKAPYHSCARRVDDLYGSADHTDMCLMDLYRAVGPRVRAGEILRWSVPLAAACLRWHAYGRDGQYYGAGLPVWTVEVEYGWESGRDACTRTVHVGIRADTRRDVLTAVRLLLTQGAPPAASP